MKDEIFQRIIHKESQDLLNSALLLSNTDKEAFEILNQIFDKAVSKLCNK